MNDGYCAFRNTDGETAFLAGAVDALCGIFLARSCPKYCAIETDVFALPDDLDFSEMLRAGISRYVPLTREPEKHAERLKNAEFTFSEINESPAAVIEDVYTRYSENSDNSNKRGDTDVAKPATKSPTGCRRPKAGGGNIGDFFAEVEYHLGKPKRLFKVESGIWTDYYTYYTGIIIETFLVEYENYAVLIVFGSDE